MSSPSSSTPDPPPLIPFEESNSAGNTTAVLVTAVVALTLAILSAIARIYTRLYSRQGVGLDGYMVVGSTIGLSVCGGLLQWCALFSLDLHGLKVNLQHSHVVYVVAAYGLWLADVLVEGQLGLSGHDLERITLYHKMVYVVAMLYFVVSGTAMLSILLMYRRIFQSDKAFNIQLIVVSALVFGWALTGTIASVFNCVPVEKAWELPINDERYCYNYNIFWLAMGIFEVILNIMILGLPMASLRKLNIPPANKLSAGGIFFLGVL